MSNERDDWANLPGKLIVLSGPSGSGKSTLVQRLLALPNLRLKVSTSATTRSPRPGEQPDRDCERKGARGAEAKPSHHERAAIARDRLVQPALLL